MEAEGDEKGVMAGTMSEGRRKYAKRFLSKGEAREAAHRVGMRLSEDAASMLKDTSRELHASYSVSSAANPLEYVSNNIVPAAAKIAKNAGRRTIMPSDVETVKSISTALDWTEPTKRGKSGKTSPAHGL